MSRLFAHGARRAWPAAVLLLLAAPALASSSYHYTLDGAASDVRAKVAFLGIASKTARFPAVSGQVSLTAGAPDAIALDVTLDARALRADDPVTLSRLKSPAFFDTDHYPTIRFTGNAMHRTGARSADVSGTLTARGVTRAQVLHVTFEREPARMAGGEPVGLTGQMTISRRDYGMTAWSLLVGNSVDITIRTRMMPD